MKIAYDKYYETENLFGEPYPELIDFFSDYKERGKVLDLGCGQGRDSIPLARLGFDITAIDNSIVGIEQMNHITKKEDLQLKGITGDIFKFDDYGKYDFVLLDSMFHFEKRDLLKETEFIKKIVAKIKVGSILVICIQDTGKKVDILNKIIDSDNQLERIVNEKFIYTFNDSESNHKSETNYRMIVARK